MTTRIGKPTVLNGRTSNTANAGTTGKNAAPVETQHINQTRWEMMMTDVTKSNGASTVETHEMSTSAKLDLIVEGLADLNNQVTELTERYDELIEKLSNLSLPGSDFSTLDEIN